MTTAGGIAAALFHREKTGEPSVVDVSLLGTAMWIMAPDIVLAKFTDAEMPTFPRTQAPNPIVNSYKTKDGRWIFLNMLQPDRFWADFCTHIGRADMITDARFESGMARFQNREACVAELDKTFAAHTLAEWREKLDTVEGVWAPMQTAKEVGFDRQALANGYLSEVDRGDGTTFTLVSSPVQFDETTPTLAPGPDMGQHTESVLLELGYTWDDLAALKEAGAIS
jgi:crotonobetainyl-CoA:carnitine CoA-transferase CaiB-like acyl-CoA transferase